MPQDTPVPTELAGLLWTWWRGDPLPALPPIDGFGVTASTSYPLLSRLSGLDMEQIRARLTTAHRPYLAWIGSEPIAYGWCAAGETHFGAPPITFRVPPGNRYLLDFATLPPWRGRGLYPCLLQAILAHEPAERFWILHHRDNAASARGIEKAGFGPVAEIQEADLGGLGLVGVGTTGRAGAGADLLGLPILEGFHALANLPPEAGETAAARKHEPCV